MKWPLLVTLSCLRLRIVDQLAKQKKNEMDIGVIYRV